MENDNGKKEIKFKYFISIGMLEDGQMIVQTNAPSEVIGYGLCEFGKKGVDVHLQRTKEKNKPLIQKVAGAFGGRIK